MNLPIFASTPNVAPSVAPSLVDSLQMNSRRKTVLFGPNVAALPKRLPPQISTKTHGDGHKRQKIVAQK